MATSSDPINGGLQQETTISWIFRVYSELLTLVSGEKNWRQVINNPEVKETCRELASELVNRLDGHPGIPYQGTKLIIVKGEHDG